MREPAAHAVSKLTLRRRAPGHISTSPHDVSFAAGGDCTISGSTVHITGAGSCTITASQAGDDDYNAAPDVAQTFAIAKADQTISFDSLADKILGDSDFTVGATASSGLPVSFAALGSCTVTGDTVHLTAIGTCTITASQAGNDDYNAALDISRTFAVHWPFSGFFVPVDNPPTLNVAQGGQGIPVKFGLSGYRGLQIFASGSPSSSKITCDLFADQDSIEVAVTAGNSSLSYDATADQYNYVWKTDKSWKGTCRRVDLKLIDGTTHSANVKFK